jgi:hypothetical membrane protein
LNDDVTTVMRKLAIGGAVSPAVFTTVVIVAGAIRPDYSHLNQFISELGAAGTADAWVMNVLGFITSGVLMAGFGLATIRLLSSGRRSIIAGGLITLYGLCMIVAGIFPCDPGCPLPPPSVAATIHDRVSTVSLLAAVAGTGLWAVEFRRLAFFSDLWKLSAVLAGASLLLLVVVGLSLESRVLIGLWQRLLVATLFVWSSIVAMRLSRMQNVNKPAVGSLSKLPV